MGYSLSMSDQNFVFPDPKTTDPKKRRVQRAIEMIPGLLTWTTLLGMVVLSFFLPGVGSSARYRV